jgi:hypothetical protein
MAKGKYAAKAANRNAQIDNELLDEAKSRIKDLEARLDTEKLARQSVERKIYSDAQRLAAEMAADSIEGMRQRVAEVEVEASEKLRTAGEKIMDIFHEINLVPMDRIDEIIATLHIEDRGEIMNYLFSKNKDIQWARRNRRQRTSRAGMYREFKKQESGGTWGPI